MKRRTAIALVFFLLACGKKGTPRPPVPLIPAPTTDLTVLQSGSQVVLSWSYPSTTVAGEKLGRVSRIRVYRTIEPLPASIAGEVTSQGVTGEVARAALFSKMLPMVPEAFEKARQEIAKIDGEEIPGATIGTRVVFRDLAIRDGGHVRLSYAVVTESPSARSGLSNLVSIVPIAVPHPPTDLVAKPGEHGVELEWKAPLASIAEGADPEIVGYLVFRHPGTEGPLDDLVPSVTPIPIAETTYRDRPPFGEWRYSVAAVTLAGPPVQRSDPGVPVVANFEDLQAPPPPGNVTALLEENAVRLQWDEVTTEDFAGFKVYRTIDGKTELITPEPFKTLGFQDQQVPAGATVVYGVTSLDARGNESAPANAPAVLMPR